MCHVGLGRSIEWPVHGKSEECQAIDNFGHVRLSLGHEGGGANGNTGRETAASACCQLYLETVLPGKKVATPRESGTEPPDQSLRT